MVKLLIFYSIYELLFFIIFVDTAREEIVMTGIDNSSSCMALIPYEPPVFFKTFRKNERNFEFYGHSVKLHQSWEESGVAAVVWDAAIVLGKYLEHIGNKIRRKRVIELGAGTGLVGIVAAILGARVTITDREQALEIAQKNIDSNLGKDHPLVRVKVLDWGQDVTAFSPPYDYILGADIVYIEETFEKLLKSLRDLCGEKTVILLSCKIRYKRDKKFLEMFGKDFDFKEVHYAEDLDIHVFEGRLNLSAQATQT